MGRSCRSAPQISISCIDDSFGRGRLPDRRGNKLANGFKTSMPHTARDLVSMPPPGQATFARPQNLPRNRDRSDKKRANLLQMAPRKPSGLRVLA